MSNIMRIGCNVSTNQNLEIKILLSLDIDGLVQDASYFIANTLELLQFSIKPSTLSCQDFE